MVTKLLFGCAVLWINLFVSTVIFAADKVVVVPLGGTKAAVGQTGQKLCYDENGDIYLNCNGTGQDGEYQAGLGVSPRFSDNGNGTVKDNLTQLIWLKSGNCDYFFPLDITDGVTRPWQAALVAVNKLSSGKCGLNDGSVAGNWRLPNIKELLSLVDYKNTQPTLPTGHPFLGIVDRTYWSSTTSMYNPILAWTVAFEFGDVFEKLKTYSTGYAVIAVRGGL